MKRFLIFAVVSLLLIMAMMPVCFALDEVAETVTADVVDEPINSDGVDISYREQEEIVKDVINELLANGSEMFAGMKWWEVVSTWISANFDAVIAFIGGFITITGSLLMILRYHPKIKQYVNSLGVSCKTWFQKISNGIENILACIRSLIEKTSSANRKIDRLEKATMLLVDAFEDVVKLSGADEGKKEIYISTIESAKKALGEEIRDNNKESDIGEV